MDKLRILVVEDSPRCALICAACSAKASRARRSRQDVAEITVGSTGDRGAHVCFVRDKGAAFDMQYARKMFSPFQRFHTDAEYEGTGTGLSIVYRIIDRLGGRVWAESRSGGGATFFFTLPRPNHGALH